MKSVYLLAITMFVSFGFLSAQDHSNVQKCGHTEYQNSLYEQYPDLIESEAAYNEMLKQAIKMAADNHVSNKTTDTHLDTTTEYRIALVFHILHTYNEYGSDWLSDDRVKACVESINHDFNGCYQDTADVVNYFKDKVGDIKITFVLANRDPQGNCTNGINRIYTYKALNGTDASKLEQWPQDKYMNIWVANNAGSEGVAAYAIKPPSASAMPYRDGVMAWNSYVVGRPSSRASTISHEIGHLLSLDHLWGGTNTPGVACGDDGIEDTPPTKGNSAGNCSDSAFLHQREVIGCWDDTIANPHYKQYILDPNCVSNVQNIMEYAYCDRMFTKGQSRAMRAVLQNYTGSTTNGNRENLITPATHIFTGIDLSQPVVCAPIADFHTDERFQLENSFDVRYDNYSYNTDMNGASYAWSTPNASITSGNGTNFITQYPTGNGWNEVSLTTTAGGQSDTKTKSNYVFVQHTTPSSLQDFEDDNKNDWWPIFNYFENQFKWELTTQGGNSGTNAIVYRGLDTRSWPANIVGNAQDDFDDFFTEVFNISNLNEPKLNFYISGAATTSDIGLIQNDQLEISYSTNGGRTWRTLTGLTLNGPQMYTKGAVLYAYNATGPWDYTPITMDLPNNAKSDNTIFRFRMKPGDYTNQVFIDDINVTELPTGINDLTEEDMFSINPNPLGTSGSLIINSHHSFDETILNITDVTGRVIYQEVLNSNLKTHSVARDIFPSAGFYIVTLTHDGKTLSHKLNVL